MGCFEVIKVSKIKKPPQSGSFWSSLNGRHYFLDFFKNFVRYLFNKLPVPRFEVEAFELFTNENAFRLAVTQWNVQRKTVVG